MSSWPPVSTSPARRRARSWRWSLRSAAMAASSPSSRRSCPGARTRAWCGSAVVRPGERAALLRARDSREPSPGRTVLYAKDGTPLALAQVRAAPAAMPGPPRDLQVAAPVALALLLLALAAAMIRRAGDGRLGTLALAQALLAGARIVLRDDALTAPGPLFDSAARSRWSRRSACCPRRPTSRSPACARWPRRWRSQPVRATGAATAGDGRDWPRRRRRRGRGRHRRPRAPAAAWPTTVR